MVPKPTPLFNQLFGYIEQIPINSDLNAIVLQQLENHHYFDQNSLKMGIETANTILYISHVVSVLNQDKLLRVSASSRLFT